MAMTASKTSCVSAVLLAAGKSTRMGENKLLLPFGGGTVIERTLDNLLASRAGEVIVVLGSKADEIGARIGRRGVTQVFNENYARGMSTSLTAGLKLVNPEARFVLVALGDQPLISPYIYNKLIAAAVATRKGIVIPVRRGERGNPILIAAYYKTELLKQSGDVGGRELLKAHSGDILEVPVSSGSVLVNLNTPDEYRKHLVNV